MKGYEVNTNKNKGQNIKVSLARDKKYTSKDVGA